MAQILLNFVGEKKYTNEKPSKPTDSLIVNQRREGNPRIKEDLAYRFNYLFV